LGPKLVNRGGTGGIDAALKKMEVKKLKMAKKTEENNQEWPEPPDYLSEKARKLYFFYIGRTIKTPGQIALFIRGLESMDTADKCGLAIREEGLSVRSERSKLVRKHPLFDMQKQATSEMLKIWRMLALNNLISTWDL